jgi:hypothetical protein
MRHVFAFICLGAIAVMSLALATYIVLTRFSPDDEMHRMLQAMSRAQTANEDGGFSWVREENGQRFTTTVYTKGQVNLADPSNIEYGTRFRVVRIGKGLDYEDLAGEIRLLDGTTYLTYAPPGPDVTGVDFGKRNTWVSFAQGELPRWGEIIPSLNEPWSSDDADWSQDGMVRLRQLLSVADVFVVQYNQLTELIDGQNTRILDGRFDPDAIRSFLRDVIRAREGREPTDEERLLVEKQASALEKLTLRLWIGVQDHRLYRFQAAGAVPAEDSTTLVPVDIIVKLSNFDEPFAVQEPDQTVSFSQILARTLAGLPSAEAADFQSGEATFLDGEDAHLPVSTVEKNKDSDHDGLDDILEAFYGTDPNNPDTDGDGVSDGDEVRSGRNPRGEGSLFGFGLGSP